MLKNRLKNESHKLGLWTEVKKLGPTITSRIASLTIAQGSRSSGWIR